MPTTSIPARSNAAAPFGMLQRLLRIAPPQVFLVLLMTAVVSVVIFAVSESTSGRINQTRAEVRQTNAALTQLALLRSSIHAAESSQRGFLLTSAEDYLLPFESATTSTQNALSELASLTGDDLEQRARVEVLRTHVNEKLDELKLTVFMVRQGERDRAMQQLNTGIGLALMRNIVQKIDELEPVLRAEVRRRTDALDTVWLQQRIGVGVVVLINLAFLAVLANMMIRQFTQREEHRLELQLQTETLEQAVGERTEELSALSTYLQTSSERDKARLARDLHDELGGILTSAKIDIAWLEGHSKASDPDAVPRLQRLSAVLDEAVDLKRRVVENLRPSLLDHLGLGPALEWYATETCAKAGLRCGLSLPEVGEAVPPEMAIAVYRLVQEGLTNTIKYAHAQSVDISVERVEAGEGHEHPGYRLVLSDDGTGIQNFKPDHLSHGMAGMRQRARALGGSFEVSTAPGKGTTIEAFFPLRPTTAEADGKAKVDA